MTTSGGQAGLDAAAYERLGEAVTALVAAAGAVVLRTYRADFAVASKADASPVTQADLDAHAVLAAGLAALRPRLPILSEEGAHADASVRQGWNACWIVDPLDGTREFVGRNDEFTVNVALVEHGHPTLGCVGVPARDEVFLGIVPLARAWRVDLGSGERERITTRRQASRPVVTASRSHRGEALEALMKEIAIAFPDVEERPVGSALKLVELARGAADAYPRRGPCSEWDIAAGEAVLAAAGGMLRDFEGAPLGYNKSTTLLNPDFWAVGDPEGGLARFFLQRSTGDGAAS